MRTSAAFARHHHPSRPSAATARGRLLRRRVSLLAFGLALGLSRLLARAGQARPADDAAPPQVTRLALPFSGVWGVIQGSGAGTHVGYATYALDFVPAVRAA